jgi:hypothetical protein
METVVEDQTPLADYLIGAQQAREQRDRQFNTNRLVIGEGEADQSGWAPPDQDVASSSPPSSPGFAPKGRPTVPSRFRSKTPDPMGLVIPRTSPLSRIKSTYAVWSLEISWRLNRPSNSTVGCRCVTNRPSREYTVPRPV